MRLKHVAGLATLFAGLLCVGPARAYDVGDPEDLASFQVHGFASQGYLLSLKNDYLVKDSTRGSFRFTEVGLNITKQLSERTSFGVQAMAQDFSGVGNFNLRADWFYVDYKWKDWLGLRAGRMKIPYGLMNEFNDIDAARQSILMPQSVYSQQARELLFAQTGFEAYGFHRFNGLGALNYKVYAGRMHVQEGDLRPANANYRIAPNVPWVAGGRLIYETPLEGLRLSYSFEAVRMNVSAYLGTPLDAMMVELWVRNRSKLHVASAEYTYDALVVRAEYARSAGEQESNDPTSDALDVKGDKFYAQATYRVNELVWLGTYYALSYPNHKKRNNDKENVQHDLAGTVRIDLTENVLLKAEAHVMQGTAGLVNQLQIGPQPAGGDRTWAVFLLKTTGYF